MGGAGEGGSGAGVAAADGHQQVGGKCYVSQCTVQPAPPSSASANSTMHAPSPPPPRPILTRHSAQRARQAEWQCHSQTHSHHYRLPAGPPGIRACRAGQQRAQAIGRDHEIGCAGQQEVDIEHRCQRSACPRTQLCMDLQVGR